MANRLQGTGEQDPFRALEKARADLSRTARMPPSGSQPSATETAESRPSEADLAAALAARLDLLRARLARAREDTVSALLFLGDAQRDCDALAETCEAAGWRLTAGGVALLSDALRRAVPSERRHLDLVGLIIDALYALRRAESRPDMGRAGADLLRGLRLAATRELGQAGA